MEGVQKVKNGFFGLRYYNNIWLMISKSNVLSIDFKNIDDIEMKFRQKLKNSIEKPEKKQNHKFDVP